MLILALDTTTRGGSVAVTRGDDLVALVAGDASRTHGERLPGEITACLQQASLEARELDLLAVAAGPGAFTGLRIGLAAIQGLAMVLDKPVVGVSALHALAWTAWRELEVPHRVPVATWMDAQRGEIFNAMYDAAEASDEGPGGWREVIEPNVAMLAQALDDTAVRLRGPLVVAGDAAVHHAAAIEARGGGEWRALREVPLLAPAIARLARRLAAAGAAGPPHRLRPIYVRRPDAELERERHR